MKILGWGVYLIVFCLPLYLVRFKIFGIPTTVLEILIYILFIFWLINNLIQNTKYKIRATKPLFIPIILILLGVSLATVFSSDLRTSTGIWKAWFVDPILLFIVLISVIKNFEQFKKALFSLFLSGTIVSIIALVYLILGKLDPVNRLQAFYTSPNYLAMYLAPALLISFGYLSSHFLRPAQRAGLRDSALLPRSYGDRARFGLIIRSRIIPKIFVLLSIVCLLLSIIFTKSFGVWFGIIAAIGFGLFLYLYKRNRKLIWLVICLGLLLIFGLGCLKFNQPEADQSLNARLVIWQKAWEIFKENPLLGIGPGTFGNYFPPYPEWGVPQPHNIFLAFLLQSGIVGFIGFIWLLIWFFSARGGPACLAGRRALGWRFNTDQPRAGSLQLLLVMIMVYILVHGLIDTTYWKNDLSAVFWIIIGLLAVLKKEP